MKMELMEDLYAAKLQQTLEAEKQLLQELPELAKAASAPELKQGFEKHAEQTRGHVDRVQQCIKSAGPARTNARPMVFEALLRETHELLREGMDPEMANAVLVGAGQKVEHLEMACYGELIAIARALGRAEESRLLEQNLNEERRMHDELVATGENVVLEASATEEAVR